jgi:hypothetical protein
MELHDHAAFFGSDERKCNPPKRAAIPFFNPPRKEGCHPHLKTLLILWLIEDDKRKNAIRFSQVRVKWHRLRVK